MLLGLSILIASVSFLCYRHPPTSWSCLQWLIRPSIHDIAAKKEDAPTPLLSHDDPSPPAKEPSIPPKEEKSPIVTRIEAPDQTKAALDRKAMPPPPLVKKPNSNSKSLSPPTTTQVIDIDATPTVPTFTLANPQDDSHSDDDDDEEEDNLPPPSFPALNSAQRARGPPRLNTLSTPSTPSTSQNPILSPAPNSTSTSTPNPNPNLMLPPPPRSLPLPNRNPTSTSKSTGGLAPPPTHTSIPSKPRKKVLLTPGHSPLDWARLTSSPHINLRGLPLQTPYLKVPPSLLSQFNGRPSKPPTFDPISGQRVKKDAWTVLGGKVYNITPYLPFHPGGEGELLRVAGGDGTRLFGEVHPWVNWEGMLEGCLIGVVVGEEEAGGAGGSGGLEDMD